MIVEVAIGVVCGAGIGFVIGVIVTISDVKRNLKKLGSDSIEGYFKDTVSRLDDLSLVSNPELAGSKEYQDAVDDRKKVED